MDPSNWGDLEQHVSQSVVQLIAAVDEFKGRWQALRALSPERLRALRHVATIESIGSSTRIEGARLTDRQIETLLANLRRQTFKQGDEQEVVGYADAMDLVFQSSQELTLTENHFKQLHSVLLRQSQKDQYHRGEYKKSPNNVIAYDREGLEIGVVFETAPPYETPWRMERLIADTNTALGDKSIHPLLVIAGFVVNFLAIHPFQDGNGRLSRILTTLMLLRSGYDYVPYASLESVIEENKDLYYQALRKTQATLGSDQPDLETWTVFFLRCLRIQTDHLATKLGRERLISESLPKLSVAVIELLREHERLTASELERLTGGNRNTMKVRLRQLTEAGWIIREGKARATRYALKPGKYGTGGELTKA
jgi:Fic family protein